MFVYSALCIGFDVQCVIVMDLLVCSLWYYTALHKLSIRKYDQLISGSRVVVTIPFKTDL